MTADSTPPADPAPEPRASGSRLPLLVLGAIVVLGVLVLAQDSTQSVVSVSTPGTYPAAVHRLHDLHAGLLGEVHAHDHEHGGASDPGAAHSHGTGGAHSHGHAHPGHTHGPPVGGAVPPLEEMQAIAARLPTLAADSDLEASSWARVEEGSAKLQRLLRSVPSVDAYRRRRDEFEPLVLQLESLWEREPR